MRISTKSAPFASRIAWAVACASLGLPGGASAQDAATPARALTVETPIERQIQGTESHDYEIVLEAGAYVRGVVAQRGADVIVTVTDPHGAQILEVDSPNGSQGEERVEWPAETAGAYRIQIRPFDADAGPGRYEVSLAEVLTPEEYAAELAAAKAERDAVVLVPEPAYPGPAGTGPRVLFDEAHNNAHTTSLSYEEFTELLRNDGYQVEVNNDSLTAARLAEFDVLLLPTPQAFPNDAVNRSAPEITQSSWNDPALSEEECTAVQDWVRSGGALLLIVGHAPRAYWSQPLAARFGVDVNNSFSFDEENSDRTEETFPPGCWIIFARESGTIGDHPITRGRGPEERVDRITVNGSSSIAGPPGSVAFLPLAASAREWVATDFAFWRDAEGYVGSAAGRAHGVALLPGEGRVVVLTPTALFGFPYMQHAEMGQSRQLGLNILHWLSGLLDA